MTRKAKIIVGGCAAGVAGIAVIGFLILWFVLPGMFLTPRSYGDAQMWSVTHQWTRTAPLPAEATEVTITSDGSDFTRQFKASFRLAPDVLEKWIAASPGFSDADLTVEPDGSKFYRVRPGGGALSAEIVISPDHVVVIDTCWS